MRLMGGTFVAVLKGALADRQVVATAFLVILLATTLIAAIPVYSQAVAESSLRERLERAPATERNVQVTAALFGGGSDRQLDASVTGAARSVLGDAGLAIFRSGESEPFVTRRGTVVFGYFDHLPGHARLLSGRWPRAGAGLEIVVPEVAARALDLGRGEWVHAQSRLQRGREVEAEVVGVYRPQQPASAYWWGNPLTSSGAFGPLVTTRESFYALGLDEVEVRWRLQPDTRRLTLSRAPALRRGLAGFPQRLNAERSAGEELDVATNLPEILAGAERSLRLARAGVLVPSIQLALLAIYGLIVTAGLLVDRRRKTTESLRLRGASTGQIVTMALLEAGLVAVPAVAIAPWLAAGSLRALNVAGPLADIGLKLEPELSGAAYALAAGAGAVCVAALVLPALRGGRAAIVRERRRLPIARFAQRTHLDLMLVALALLGYWQLRRYHGVLAGRDELGVDPFLVLAPALLLLAGAVLALRLIPLVAGLVERFVPMTNGPVAALGFWQLARRPRVYARSVLLLVLAVAIGVFAATYSRTWHRSQIDQARYAAGADVRVEPSEAAGAPGPVTTASSYRALGASDALPAVTHSPELGRVGTQAGNLLALDAKRAAGLVRVRSDFAERPLADLLRPLAEGRGRLASLPLPGKPERIAVSLRLIGLPSRAPARTAGLSPEEFRTSASFVIYLRDADGLVHPFRLGMLRPGTARRFDFVLTDRLSGGRLVRPRYPLAVIALEAETAVPFLVARRLAFEVRAIEVAGERGSWRPVSLDGFAWRGSASGIEDAYERPRLESVTATRGAVRVELNTGAFLFQELLPPTTDVVLRPGRDSLPGAVPALASDSFLAATGAEVGHELPLPLERGTQDFRIVGSFHRFPTLAPDAPAVVVDLPTYSAVSLVAHGDVAQPSQWWLRTAADREIAARLRAAPFRSLGVVSRSEREQRLLDDPVPLGVIGALALGFVAAAAFAAVGFAAGAAAAARARMLEFAVLRSLGLRTRQLSAWVGLESGLVIGLSFLGGTALGLLVSRLVLPYVTVGASGAAAVPPALVSVPWRLLLLLELAVLGALLAVAVAQVVSIRALRPAPVLRSGEGTAAP